MVDFDPARLYYYACLQLTVDGVMGLLQNYDRMEVTVVVVLLFELVPTLKHRIQLLLLL